MHYTSFFDIKSIGAILGIIILFSLVALIVLVLTPGVGWLERHRMPRPYPPDRGKSSTALPRIEFADYGEL